MILGTGEYGFGEDNNMEKSKAERKKHTYSVSKIVWLIILLALLGYHGYKLVDKYKFNRQWEYQSSLARSNAVKYVKEKYGIDAEVISLYSDQNKNNKYLTEKILKNDYTYVELSDGEKNFNVRVNWKEESTDGYDTYEYEKILNAVNQKIEAAFPESEVAACSVFNPIIISADFNLPIICGNRYNELYLAKNEKFDEIDLESVLQRCEGQIYTVCADAVFDGCELFDFLQKNNFEGKFISLTDKAILDEFVSSSEINRASLFEEQCKKYAPYITDRRKITKNGHFQSLYDLKSIDEFNLYFCPDEHGSGSKIIGITNAGSIFKNYKTRKIDSFLSESLSEGYDIKKVSWGKVYIYYPLNKLEGHDLNDIGAAWFGDHCYDIARPTVAGDYAVFELSELASQFVITDTKGMETFTPNYKR